MNFVLQGKKLFTAPKCLIQKLKVSNNNYVKKTHKLRSMTKIDIRILKQCQQKMKKKKMKERNKDMGIKKLATRIYSCNRKLIIKISAK